MGTPEFKKSAYLSGTLGMFPFGGSSDKGNNVLSCTVVGDVYLDKCLQVEYLPVSGVRVKRPLLVVILVQHIKQSRKKDGK